MVQDEKYNEPLLGYSSTSAKNETELKHGLEMFLKSMQSTA